MTRLRDLGDWSGGNTPSKENAAYWSDGTIPWVSPKDMKVDEITSSEDRVTEAALKQGRVSMVPEGSVLVVTRSGILSHTLPVAVTKTPVTINQDLKALTPKAGVLPKYVAHALRGASRRILKQCSKHGTTVASIETNALLDFEIPLVDLDEQRRIVAEIEKQFSRLDEAVANLKRVKANLKRYKEATIRDVSVAAKRGSPISTAAELFSWSSGVNLPASKQHGGPVPVYGGNGIAGFHSQDNISEATVVIGRVGAGCGNVHLVREPAWITDNAIYASRVADTIFLPYAALMFRAANLNSRAAGSGQPFVNQRMLNEVQMPLPSLDEQHRIVAEVDRRLSIVREVDAEIDLNLKRAARLRDATLRVAFSPA
jgi:type I restriction enzyme S subunit